VISSHWLRFYLPTLALVLACSSSDKLRSEQPLIQELQSTDLEEADSLFVGRPTAFSVDRSHGFLIADGLSDRLLRFDSTGHADTVVWKTTPGVGKVSAIAQDGDGRVAVAIARENKLLVGAVNDSVPQYAVFTRGPIGSIASRPGGGWWVVTIDLTSRMAVHSLDSGVLSSSGGNLPVPHREAPGTAQIMWGSAAKATPTSVSYVFHGSDSIYTYRPSSGTVSARGIELPGVIMLEHRLRELPPRSQRDAESIVYGLPVPTMLGQTMGERAFIVWMYAKPRRGALTGTIRVQLLPSNGVSGCLSDTLPVASAPYPRVSVSGDTIQVLEQTTVAGATRTRIRQFRIHPVGCRASASKSARPPA